MDLVPVGLLTWYFIRERTLKMTLKYVTKNNDNFSIWFVFFFMWFQSPSLAQVKIEEAKRELVSILSHRLIDQRCPLSFVKKIISYFTLLQAALDSQLEMNVDFKWKMDFCPYSIHRILCLLLNLKTANKWLALSYFYIWGSCMFIIEAVCNAT